MSAGACSDWHMTAGEKVRALRKALGLTQMQLAERSGGAVVQGEIAKVESGRNKLSTYELRSNLAQALGLSLESLRAYLDGEIELRAVVAQAGKADVGPEVRAPAPARSPRLERDPVPHLDTSHLSRPLDRAIGHAFDPKRHDWADGQDVIQALHGLNRHDRPEADMIEAARRWLDAAHELRREGTPVNAETLLDRITFGKGPVRPGPDEASAAMQRQVVEHAAKEGVTFGEGAAAIEAFRRGGKKGEGAGKE